MQTDVYNELATAWQTVLQNINEALEVTDAKGNSNAKGAALSAFWGAHQRFFNQIITSMQTPMAIDDIQKQIDAGHAIVIQLVNTNEATQEREFAKASENDVILEELDFTPRQQLISYIENSFPVQQYHQVQDADGNISFEPTKDSNGNPVFNKEAIRMRDELIQTLETIRVPDNPLDSIINHFGSEMVAEVTGRSRRFVHGKDDTGEFKVIEEKRGSGSSQADAQAFQNDKKKILLFSAAGGTGFSFHADNTAINQRKRYHYILQAGWRADSAVQGFGRTHRTNQKQPPHYVLPTTSLKAQKRFISSVARRLDQLGALTRGQRQTTSQGLLTASDNLESSYARQAIYTLFQDMYRDRTVGLNFHEVTREMGLNLIDERTGAIKDDKIPTTTQFLNRLLSLTTHRQDQVFEAFEDRLIEAVDHAKQQGIFDEGVQVFRAKNIVKTSDTTVFTEPKSGAQTRIVELEVTNDKKYADWNAISAIKNSSAAKNEDGGFFVGLSGKFKDKVFYLKDRHSLLNAEGKEVHRGVRYGIDGLPNYIDNANEVLQGYRYGMLGGRYQQIPISKKITEAEAKELWAKELEVAPKTETEKMNILVGAILPIWDRIGGKDYTIYRTQTDSGEQLLGRLLSEQQTKETLKNLGVESDVTRMSHEDLFTNVQAGNKAILANGWAITSAKVNNETRIEIRSRSEGSSYFTPANQKLLEEQGVYVERIQWQDRLFIPNNENGQEVFNRIIASKPVVEIQGDKIIGSIGRAEEQNAQVLDDFRKGGRGAILPDSEPEQPEAKQPEPNPPEQPQPSGTLHFTKVSSIILEWSEASQEENKVFHSFNDLQKFMLSEYENVESLPAEHAYHQHKISVSVSTENGENTLNLAIDEGMGRIDVGTTEGDFNPFTMNLSEYIAQNFNGIDKTSEEGEKYTITIPIEPNLPMFMFDIEFETDLEATKAADVVTEPEQPNEIQERDLALASRNKEIFFSELVDKYGWERDADNGVYKLNPNTPSNNYIHISTDLNEPFMRDSDALAFSGKEKISYFVSFVMSEMDISGNYRPQSQQIQDAFAKDAAININTTVDKWILTNQAQPVTEPIEAKPTAESETIKPIEADETISVLVFDMKEDLLLKKTDYKTESSAYEEFDRIARADLTNSGSRFKVQLMKGDILSHEIALDDVPIDVFMDVPPDDLQRRDIEQNSILPEEVPPAVNVAEPEPVKAWMMTSAEFAAIATAEPLINHGRKWEVFAGGQTFGFTDSETAAEAIKEAHERSVNNALYSRTEENSVIPVKEMPPAEVLAEYPQTVARFPELFPETVNPSESTPKSEIASEAEKIMAEISAEKITVATEAQLRVTKKLTNALTDILDSTGVDSSHEFITVHFSDPEYSHKTGGYHPVEISINGDDGKINYITDYTYFGRDRELVKDLDFDFQNGVFQQLGLGHSREYPIREGAGLFRTWQSNFSHYLESGVFDVEVRSDKGVFKIEPEVEAPIHPSAEQQLQPESKILESAPSVEEKESKYPKFQISYRENDSSIDFSAYSNTLVGAVILAEQHKSEAVYLLDDDNAGKYSPYVDKINGLWTMPNGDALESVLTGDELAEYVGKLSFLEANNRDYGHYYDAPVEAKPEQNTLLSENLLETFSKMSATDIDNLTDDRRMAFSELMQKYAEMPFSDIRALPDNEFQAVYNMFEEHNYHVENLALVAARQDNDSLASEFRVIAELNTPENRYSDEQNFAWMTRLQEAKKQLFPEANAEKTEPEEPKAAKSEPIINSIENITQLELFNDVVDTDHPASKNNQSDVDSLRQKINANKAEKAPEQPKQTALPVSEQQPKQDTPASPKNTAPAPAEEIDKRIPPEVAAKYIQVENQFFHRKNKDLPVFEDKGSKLETKLNSSSVAIDLVKIATERNWKIIKINGTDEFKREVWMEAETRGLKTVGYKPTEFDKAILAERLSRATTNSIEEFKPLEKTQTPETKTSTPNAKPAVQEQAVPALKKKSRQMDLEI